MQAPGLSRHELQRDLEALLHLLLILRVEAVRYRVHPELDRAVAALHEAVRALKRSWPETP